MHIPPAEVKLTTLPVKFGHDFGKALSQFGRALQGDYFDKSPAATQIDLPQAEWLLLF